MIPQTELATAFRYEDVNFFEYQPRSNPAYTDASLGHMNILADIVASMNEHAPVDFPGDPKLTHSTATVLVKAIEKTETAAPKQTTFSILGKNLRPARSSVF
jgi:Mn-containing catalase